MNIKIVICAILFLYAMPFTIAQDEQVLDQIDMINFNDIKIYNKVLNKEIWFFTDFDNIANFVNNSKATEGKYYPARNVPFYDFPEKTYVTIVYTDYFHYVIMENIVTNEKYSNDIYIQKVVYNKDVSLFIDTIEDRIIIDDKTSASDLGKYFKKSYMQYLNNKNKHKSFQLKVIQNNKISYLRFYFENNFFDSVFLSNNF